MPLLTSVSARSYVAKKKGQSISYVAPTITPSYAPAAAATVNEGNGISITLNTTEIPNEATITYTISGVAAADYSTSNTSPLIVNSNSTSASFILNEDLTTEGPETFTFTYSYTYTHPVDGVTTITGTANWTVGDASTTPADPTYVLGANKATVDEGSNITITLTTALLGADTSVGYTITGVSSADLNGASLTGSFLTGTTDSISLSVAADATTEGPESIVFTLDNGQDAITIPINDTSLNPTYSLTTSSAEVNEGDTINITLTTTDISNGTEIPYTITGVTTDDINDASLTGIFVIQSGTATLAIAVTADASLSEGAETLQIVLDNGAGGTVQVTINDSSVNTTPAYLNLTLQTASTIDEGQGATFRITGRNIATNTTIAYTITGVSGTISSSDFSPASLTRTVTWAGSLSNISQTQDFTVTLALDEITEGTESFKVVLAATDSASTSTGSLESPTVTITDTSLTPIIGQQDFLSSTTWVVPDDVISVSMLAISGGGGAGGTYNSGVRSGSGGGGGALAYKNNVTVTPGETLTIAVGAAGAGGARNNPGTSGGNSNVLRSATLLVSAEGGGAGSFTGGGAGGNSSVTDGGGTGGTGGDYSTASRGGGGAGAGGYSGNGGDGQDGTSTSAGGSGSGGGGGGAGAAATAVGASGGGGVGILGEGASGAGGNYQNDGFGGSGGQDGQDGIGGTYGGGGSGGLYSGNPATGLGRDGAPGAVRIIYPGTGRQYPSTRTVNEAAVTGTYDSLTVSTTSLNENLLSGGNVNVVTLTLSTTSVPQNTTVGTSIVSVSGTVNASDFSSAPSLFTIDASGNATIQLTTSNDFATEGTESFRIQLAATDSVGNDTASLQSPVVSISDDSIATVYSSISLDKSTYNEGDTITITVNKTGNNSISTQVGYTISASGSGDFNQTSGVLTLLDGNTYEGSPYSASKTIITSDLTTEGTETLTVTLGSTDSNGNSTGGISTTATIVDTSQAPRIPGTGFVRSISRPSTATWFGQGYLFGSGGIGGDNDFIIVGDDSAGTDSSFTNPNSGQAVIFNRATGATVRVLNSPTAADSNTYARLSKFGKGVDITEFNGYKYACIGAPAHRNASDQLVPRIYVYKSNDGFSTITLVKTIELSEYTAISTNNTLFRGRKTFKAKGKWLIVGDYAYNSTGLCKYYDITDELYDYDYTANVMDDWTGWSVGTNGTKFVYSDPLKDGLYAGGSITPPNEGKIAMFEHNGSYFTREGYQIVGSYSNNRADNLNLGSAVAVSSSRIWFTTVGEDYNGFTNAGRLRNLIFGSSTGAIINNPLVTSTNNDELNYNSVRGLDAHGSYAVMVWADAYSAASQSVVVYNEAGTSVKTVTPTSGNKFDEYGQVVLTSEYIYLIQGPTGGGTQTIEIY